MNSEVESRDRPASRGGAAFWRWIPLVVASFYPFLRLSAWEASNPVGAATTAFDWEGFFVWGSIFMAVGAGLYLISARFVQNRNRASAAAVILLFVFTSSTAFNELGVIIGRKLGLPSPVLGFVAGALISWLLVIIVLRTDPGVTFLRVALSAYVALSLFAVGTVAGNRSSDLGPLRMETAEIDVVSLPSDPPDVFFLILDGYPSFDVLERGGLEVGRFAGRLSDFGFQVVPGVRSLYSHTILSIGSILGLQGGFGEGRFSRSDRLAALDLMSGNNPLEEAFRQAGYETIHLENAWSAVECDAHSLTCLGVGVMDGFDWAMVVATPFGGFGSVVKRNPWITGSLAQFELLREIAAADNPGSPRFILAHVLAPHPPFYMDDGCNLRYVDALDEYEFIEDGANGEDRRRYWGEQVSCVNSLVLDFIEALPQSAAVVITGDHGSAMRDQTKLPPSEWTSEDIEERFSVLWATRLPERCEESVSEVTNVSSGARVLINCLIGTALDPWPDGHLVAQWGSDGGGLLTSPGEQN